MELHHSKHHQTYVNSYNDATEKMAAAEANDDPAAKIALQPLINFHGGGHVNHSLFWENLAPKNSGGGEPPSGALAKAIEQSYGGLDGMKTKFNAALAGIQGSGWAWLVQDTQTGSISIKTYAVSISIQKRLGRIDWPSTTAVKAYCDLGTSPY
jgi:Fe-Mn family superoxide dismutase